MTILRSATAIAIPYLLLTTFLRCSTDAMRIKPTTASQTLTVSRRQTRMLRIRATRTRDQPEIHMGKRVVLHTKSKRQYRAGTELKRNHKLPMAVGTGQDRTWAMEVMVSSRYAHIAPMMVTNGR